MNIFKKNNRKLEREESIIITENNNSVINENYNRLKDNILFYSDGGKNKVIQLESSVSGEGKTTVICNLGVSLAYNHKKVVIVDLDFRKPRIHRPFKIANENGLGNYFLNEIDKNTLIKHTSYGVDIINRGRIIYNSSFLLTSDKFKNLIGELREEYDFVLIDCPPVIQISDYINISKVTDGVVFIVASGITKKSLINESISMLNKNNIKIIGAVMTYTNIKDMHNYGYYGKCYEYYGKKYGDKENK